VLYFLLLLRWCLSQSDGLSQKSEGFIKSFFPFDFTKLKLSLEWLVSTLNVGVTRMWKYVSQDFCYGHRHCLRACSSRKLLKVPLLMDPDKNKVMGRQIMTHPASNMFSFIIVNHKVKIFCFLRSFLIFKYPQFHLQFHKLKGLVLLCI
jgi:hypothetical protein